MGNCLQSLGSGQTHLNTGIDWSMLQVAVVSRRIKFSIGEVGYAFNGFNTLVLDESGLGGDVPQPTCMKNITDPKVCIPGNMVSKSIATGSVTYKSRGIG